MVFDATDTECQNNKGEKEEMQGLHMYHEKQVVLASE